MLRRNAVWLVAIVLIVTGAWIQQAMSQQAPGDPQGRRGPRDPQQMQQRMEQMRQQMADRLKASLGATDEEWKILQPKIEKVQTLARQLRSGGMGSMFGRRGQAPEGGAADNPQPQTDLQKKTAELQTLLQNKDAKPEEIKTALAALRGVRAKANAELAAAQKDLREVLTLRQEAQLVMMGLLD
ncbi:MAG TPA: hypothetical protein VNA25_01055 [Phycisphaerae bacterium]|nr:hypothetical protein [Phycisphaerae bacterium]